MRALVLLSLLVANVLGQEAVAPVVFERDIAPILLARCIDCHGEKEQKGELRLDRREHLFAAGAEDGGSVVAGKPDDSELLRRLNLPVDDDERMPAKGEPLTPAQIELFRRWIAAGADWPASGDEFLAKELAAAVLPKITFALPELDAAGKEVVAKAAAALRAQGVLVQPVAADTEALEVSLALRGSVPPALLLELVPLAPRLVWLNLSRTGLADADLAPLQKLTELRRLHLANTAVGDAGLQAVTALPQLEFLNLHGTKVTDRGVEALGKLSALKQLYLWQSGATIAGKEALLAERPGLQVDLGDYVTARLSAASAEVAARAERNRPINETCPVADKPIDPAQTSRHEGRVIGFCCAKCKAAFDKEPAKFAAKLPPLPPAAK